MKTSVRQRPLARMKFKTQMARGFIRVDALRADNQSIALLLHTISQNNIYQPYKSFGRNLEVKKSPVLAIFYTYDPINASKTPKIH